MFSFVRIALVTVSLHSNRRMTKAFTQTHMYGVLTKHEINT